MQIVATARANRESTYFTGEPCKNGHIAPRTTQGGGCTACSNRSVVANFRKTLYGLDTNQFEEMLLAQNNQCAICGTVFEKTPHVDHDHETGIVRGLLCLPCNMGLGFFRDSQTNLHKAIEYLQQT